MTAPTAPTRPDLSGVPEPLMLVDGRRVGAADGATFPVTEPATGEPIARAPHGSAADAEAAVAAARRAFDVTGWSRDVEFRLHCLRQLHDALVEDAPAMRALTVAEAGMPVSLVRGPQYDGPVAELQRQVEEVAGGGPLPAHPAGVAVALTPWTAPTRTALAQVGRALLAGSTVVLKPAADTSWLACELGRLATERTDLPPGVLSVVTTRDVDVAIALTTDPRVDVVSFTGSTVAGERVRHQAAGGGKRVDLALGGSGAAVVLDGADLEDAVRRTAHAVAEHAGQRCGTPTRLVVPRRRHEEAADLAAAAMEAFAPGDPADPDTVCGPVISPVHRDRVRRYVGLAVQEGGVLACGEALPARERGWWVAPTVVVGLDNRDRAAREEILGPVLVVLGHDGEQDAMAIAHDSPYDVPPLVHR